MISLLNYSASNCMQSSMQVKALITNNARAPKQRFKLYSVSKNTIKALQI